MSGATLLLAAALAMAAPKIRSGAGGSPVRGAGVPAPCRRDRPGPGAGGVGDRSDGGAGAAIGPASASAGRRTGDRGRRSSRRPLDRGIQRGLVRWDLPRDAVSPTLRPRCRRGGVRRGAPPRARRSCWSGSPVRDSRLDRRPAGSLAPDPSALGPRPLRQQVPRLDVLFRRDARGSGPRRAALRRRRPEGPRGSGSGRSWRRCARVRRGAASVSGSPGERRRERRSRVSWRSAPEAGRSGALFPAGVASAALVIALAVGLGGSAVRARGGVAPLPGEPRTVLAASPDAFSRRPCRRWCLDPARRVLRLRHAGEAAGGASRIHESDLPRPDGPDRRAHQNGGRPRDRALHRRGRRRDAGRRGQRPRALDAVSARRASASRKIGEFFRAPLAPYRPRLSFVRSYRVEPDPAVRGEGWPPGKVDLTREVLWIAVRIPIRRVPESARCSWPASSRIGPSAWWPTSRRASRAFWC